MDGTKIENPDLNLTSLKNKVLNLESLGEEGLRKDRDLLSLKVGELQDLNHS